MSTNRFDRQSFLGPHSQPQIEATKIGIVGLGGGGSHIAQQLAHIGFRDFVLYDADCIDVTNLNRLVGATEEDVTHHRPKTQIIERVIAGVSKTARIRSISSRWQDEPLPLRTCDVIFGAVDSFLGRHELEVLCRRYLIPYIDVGMDVHHVRPDPPRMAGQVIASIPGGPCMRCMWFLNDSILATEIGKYGDVGSVPQVVWANGQLASAAVGFCVDLITGWTVTSTRPIYLSYDGNTGCLVPHPLLPYVPVHCSHFSFSECGDPIYTSV